MSLNIKKSEDLIRALRNALYSASMGGLANIDDWLLANNLTNEIIFDCLLETENANKHSNLCTKVSEVQRSDVTEPYRVMSYCVKGTRNLVGVEEFCDFSCEMLKTIDNLWTHYSLHRFGFSTQLYIYRRAGSLKEFYKSVNWKYSEEFGYIFELCEFKSPTYVQVPEYCSLFSQDIQQWISLKKSGGFGAVRGTLPFCINLVPAVLLKLSTD